MFLKIIDLRKNYYTSSAVRFSYHFYNNLNLNITQKKLSICKKNNAGRGFGGKVIIRTKSSFLKKIKLIKINFNLRYKKLGFISSLKFVPFRNQLLSLVYFSNGAFTYYINTEFHGLFTFFYYNTFRKLKKIKIKNTILILFQIKKLSYVSCLELLPGKGAQYSLSPGTKSRLIKLDGDTHSVLVQLPSGVKKIFSYYSIAFLGQISLSENFRCLNSKAGYWRNFGIKPLVRGVAMNPVDHPHGGRAKSVKYPRTPWGKTTKFK